MFPILARYGPFFLYSYTVVIAVGLGAGLGLTAWLEGRRSWAPSPWLDQLLFSLPFALVGGRIVFVWINAAYFQEQPDEMARIWLGGLNYHGALAAGLFAAWLRGLRWDHGFLQFGGLLAPGLALAQAFGWIACWLEGCAYGKESDFGFLSADLPDAYGVFAVRYRTQHMGFMFSLLAMGLALLLQRRSGPGPTFWLTLLALSVGRLVTSLFRGDEMLMIGAWRLDTIVEVVVIVVCLVGLTVRRSLREDLTETHPKD